MKIIYLHQYFKLPREAGGTRSFDLACGFLSLGHEVEMITSSSDIKFKTKKRWSRIKEDDLTIHYLYIPYSNNMNYFERLMAFLKFLWFSTFKLLSLKGDLILATSTPLTIGIPALIKKWIHKTPYIFEARDIWPEAAIAIGAIRNKILQKILYLLEYLIYKNAEAIIPLSIDMKNSINSRYPKLASKRIEVIENISEIERFQKGYNKELYIIKEKIGFKPQFIILYAGTFGQVNGLDYVIDFAHDLQKIDSEIVFVLVGDGLQKQDVINRASNKGVIDKNVFFLDSVSKSELSQLYFECDIGSSFVINIKELWANSANKFFDTLAAGKPVLINYGGWQKDKINKENIGYVLPQVFKEDDVQKFSIYCQNISLLAKQRENALNIANKDYATQVAVAKYNKIFNDIF
tara:strand:+ start:604 stop:1821 length:1218 start_codon:yes stop_codon:yes gene_type:complete